MRALTCPLAVLSDELQARTLTAHTVFGLARYIVTPAQLPNPRHPLEFAYLLGLSSKLDWYPRQLLNLPPVDQDASTKLLEIVAHNWKRPIWELDTLMIASRLRMFSVAEQWRIACRVGEFVGSSYFPPDVRREFVKALPESSKIPKEVHDRLIMNLASLEQSLLNKDPLMPQHLRNSHAILVSYPETVHLLDNHEVARLIDAAELHTKTEIVKAVAAGKGASSKKKVDISDL